MSGMVDESGEISIKEEVVGYIEHAGRPSLEPGAPLMREEKEMPRPGNARHFQDTGAPNHTIFTTESW